MKQNYDFGESIGHEISSLVCGLISHIYEWWKKCMCKYKSKWGLDELLSKAILRRLHGRLSEGIIRRNGRTCACPHYADVECHLISTARGQTSTFDYKFFGLRLTWFHTHFHKIASFYDRFNSSIKENVGLYFGISNPADLSLIAALW